MPWGKPCYHLHFLDDETGFEMFLQFAWDCIVSQWQSYDLSTLLSLNALPSLPLIKTVKPVSTVHSLRPLPPTPIAQFFKENLCLK